jgi:penicillin-binding protein 1A
MGPAVRPYRLAFISLAAASVLAPFLVVGILAVSLFWVPLSTHLPEPRQPFDSRITRVHAADGTEIAAFHRYETSLPVEAGDIPEVLKQAVVAVEDQRFYDHRGVDPKAVLRAIWANVQNSAYTEGASTITQQYVKRMYLGESGGISDKIREAAVAARLERTLPKDEILFRYLSTAYFGGGAHGVGAAAERYFRKPVRDLTLSEAALLAGLLRSPTDLDPRSNPRGADDRRRLVLGMMRDQGRISVEEHDAAAAQAVSVVLDGERPPAGPATVIHPDAPQVTAYPYFVDYVRRYLIDAYGEEAVFEGGLRVETSLDPAMQAKAEAAVAETLRGTQPPLEMALVAVEPETGLVRALVGGRDFQRSQVNLALGHCGAAAGAAAGEDGDGPRCVDGGGTGRQPGSAFKPVTLARALEEGIPLTSGYPGPSTYTFPNCSGPGCTVNNVESSGYGWLSLRQATVSSVNTVYAQLIDDVGVKDTAETAHRLGLTTVDPDGRLPGGEAYGPSLTLGAAEVAPLDMAAAFSVFAAGGRQRPATPILRVTGPDGTVLEDNSRRAGRQVLPRDVADQVNGVLMEVVRSGTGRAAGIERPDATAGKTGTSEDYGDAWFVGYTPVLSTAVWMGYSDSRRPLRDIKGVSRVYGGTLPAETWAAFMGPVLEGREVPPFATPAAPSAPPGRSGQPVDVLSSPAPTTAGGGVEGDGPPTPGPTTAAPRGPTVPTPPTPPTPPSMPALPPPTLAPPVATTVPLGGLPPSPRVATTGPPPVEQP